MSRRLSGPDGLPFDKKDPIDAAILARLHRQIYCLTPSASEHRSDYLPFADELATITFSPQLRKDFADRQKLRSLLRGMEATPFSRLNDAAEARRERIASWRVRAEDGCCWLRNSPYWRAKNRWRTPSRTVGHYGLQHVLAVDYRCVSALIELPNFPPPTERSPWDEPLWDAGQAKRWKMDYLDLVCVRLPSTKPVARKRLRQHFAYQIDGKLLGLTVCGRLVAADAECSPVALHTLCGTCEATLKRNRRYPSD